MDSFPRIETLKTSAQEFDIMTKEREEELETASNDRPLNSLDR